MKPLVIVAFVTAVTLGPVGPGMAATELTFDAVPNGLPGCGFAPGDDSFVESGFTISNCPGYFASLGDIHLDDGGSSFQSFVDIDRIALFDALSMTIRGLGTSFLDRDTFVPLPYDNLVVTGFRNGSAVANQSFSTALLPSGSLAVFSLEAAFLKLDTVRIAQVMPGLADYAAFPNGDCEDLPCAHVDVVSITLQDAAVIPLPATLPLLVGALGVVAACARRRDR